MTTSAPASEAGTKEDRPKTWGEIAFDLAGHVASPGFRRGDLAELRRMQPDKPDAAAFWQLLARNDLLGKPVVERKWALILHGIALMTRTAGDDVPSRSAHDGNMHVGRALYLGGEAVRPQAFYSETRFNRLLTSRGPMLRTLLARMFRMMAAADVSFDWREMARFIQYEGSFEDSAEKARRLIAREYYRAEQRSARSAEDRGNN